MATTTFRSLSSNILLGAVLLLGGLVTGCVDDEPSDGPDTTVDATADARPDVADTTDTGVDGSDTGDTTEAPDTTDGGMMSCSFPEVEIAGTSKTSQLADGPEHCGMDSYKWLRDAPVGQVTDWAPEVEFQKGLLEGIADSQGFTIPRPLEYDVAMSRYTYKTQDRGEVVEASSLVAYPKGMEADEPVDVMVVLHGTSGFNDMCAPSEDAAGKGLAALFASWGYLVIAPDYIGLKGDEEMTGFLHPYLVGQATAIASLDAVRSLNHMPAGRRGELCPSNDLLVFGGSQGGHAALWVDRMQPYYAREYDLLGTVATVPPADLVAEGERALDKMVNATGNLLAFLGASSDWYGVRDRLDEVVQSPYDKDLPTALEMKCNPGDGIDVPSTTDDIFTAELLEKVRNDEFASVDPWGCMAVENSLTDTRIERIGQRDDSYGIFYVLGEKDNLVHTPIERKSFEELCNNGMPLKYKECKGAGHVETSFWAMPEILDFLDARQAGETFQGSSSCEATAPVQCEGMQ